VRRKNQDIEALSNLGTDEMRILYSPGFYSGEQYKNKLRVEYLVQCDTDELAFYNITHLDLQGKEDCKDLDENDKYILCGKRFIQTHLSAAAGVCQLLSSVQDQ
jgi:hypothetical protein